MKRAYVTLMRSLRSLASWLGVLGFLARESQRSKLALWLRSMFAIHDLDDLVPLDVPWWTFESARLVDEHLARTPNARVLEWGSGASTVWLARRAASVSSIEHHPAWAARVREHVPGHVELRVVQVGEAVTSVSPIFSAKTGHRGLDFGPYVRAVDDVAGEFDLVVIDGRAREACLEQALPRLAPGGLIVFDNVDRQRYRDAIAAQPGLDVRWTRGLTPCLPYPTRTALIRVARG